jgi:hypothetical protein
VRVKVAGHLAENAPHRLIGIIPASLVPGAYTLEIVTQYSSGQTFLKEPRTLTFATELSAAPSAQ